jgi:hypothetical protein
MILNHALLTSTKYSHLKTGCPIASQITQKHTLYKHHVPPQVLWKKYKSTESKECLETCAESTFNGKLQLNQHK